MEHDQKPFAVSVENEPLVLPDRIRKIIHYIAHTVSSGSARPESGQVPDHVNQVLPTTRTGKTAMDLANDMLKPDSHARKLVGNLPFAGGFVDALDIVNDAQNGAPPRDIAIKAGKMVGKLALDAALPGARAMLG